MTSPETEPAFHRPVDRRLMNLSNEELAGLFSIRANKSFKQPQGPQV